MEHYSLFPASSTPVTPSTLSGSLVPVLPPPVGGWLHLVRSLFAVPLQFVYSAVTKVFIFLYVLLFNPNFPITRQRENRRIRDNIQLLSPATTQRIQQNRGLMRLQEEEYARSLAADKAKRDEQVRAELRLKDEEQRAKALAEQVQNRKRRLLQKRDEIRNQLKEEPSDESDIICIKVKFPEGAVFNRKFRATDSVEELFNSVLVHYKCPEDFSLMSGYPATPLNCVPGWYEEFGPNGIQDPETIPTFADAGFQKTAVIMVRDNNA